MRELHALKSGIIYISEEPGVCIIKYMDTAAAGSNAGKKE